MAISKLDNQMIGMKIQILMAEGYPKKQATAIALRMYREGELRGTKKSTGGNKKTTKRMTPTQMSYRARRRRDQMLGRR